MWPGMIPILHWKKIKALIWNDSNLALKKIVLMWNDMIPILHWKKIKALIWNNSNLTMKNLYYEMAWFQSCTEKMLMWNDMISILH